MGAHLDYGPDELDCMPRIELYRADERGKEDGFRRKAGWRVERRSVLALAWCNLGSCTHGRRGREAGIGVFMAASASECGQEVEAGRVSDTVALPLDQVML